MDPMQAIRDTFFQECEEQLGELETGLLAMQEGSADDETVNAVFRAVHSIKGGAGAFKLDRLVKFAHAFETTLDKIRNAVLAPSDAVMKTMLRAADVLADLVTASRENGAFDDARSNELIAELNAHCEAKAAAPQEAPAEEETEANPFDALGWEPLTLSLDPEINEYVIVFRPKPELYAKGNETTRLMRELSRLGSLTVHCEIADVPLLVNCEPEQSYLSWRATLRSVQDIAAVQGVFEFVDGDCHLDIERVEPAPAPEHAPAQPAAEAAPEAACEVKAAEEPKAQAPAPREAAKAEAGGPGNATQNTIRVDLDRVDRLINLVGELVINQAMLTQRVLEAGAVKNASIATGLDDLEHLTREIQESVMAIRAQPVRPLFQRMSRIVREIADATGKNVRLKTEGEGAEVDRTVIERLADPLTHMIRNAVDHGLERPDARIAAGKPAQGEVRLSAAHKSGRVVIEIADDGRGIDRPKVKSIAIRKGLIPPDAQLTDSEIDNLLFMPGFSTAETVSNISGRGVGMDVVKRSIQALGGRIAITTRLGHGSTFSLSLPLTLAVLDGMVVRVADQTLVVPLNSILETMKPKAGEVYGLGPDSQVMGIRGGFTPLIDVGYALGFRSHRADPMTGVTLLVETEGGVRSALMVDAIQDQRQVVIKSLESNYGHVEGIAAATILGDGRIALILDTDAIVNSTSGRNSPSEMLLAG
ncbi:MAG: chemotaxis protein CheA [Pseudomonadota bacterium]|nr:chemotaxis protein CheA [Pseudomonadota bacterium]